LKAIAFFRDIQMRAEWIPFPGWAFVWVGIITLPFLIMIPVAGSLYAIYNWLVGLNSDLSRLLNPRGG
jgi:uncharacterized iron-regulated membrane protein